MLPMSFRGQSSHGHNTPDFKALDDLPKTVARTLTQGSSPMSFDFHPIKQTLLLVGTNVGDIGLWEVGSRERLVHKTFKVWDLSKCSMPSQADLVKEPVVSVNRVIWSPDGSLFGVAYSRHIVQLYSYHGGEDMRQHLEINADHVGGVNDISFSTPNRELCLITCGDDKTIKVWHVATGAKWHTFEGHEAPVYSVCPHNKANIEFIFSTALDGKIKAWLYDNHGSRASLDAPGCWCTRMAYSADGTRLFSCGTSKNGESYLVEWNDSDATVKRTYQGLHKPSLGVVQFDTTKNRFIAAGDDFSIKFWDMDTVEFLASIDGNGGLQACPRIRFNKEGSLLAVSGYENVIKVMANSDGLQLLHHAFDKISFEYSKMNNQILMMQQEELMQDQMMLLLQLQNQMFGAKSDAESNDAAAKAKQNQMMQKLIENQAILQQHFEMLMQQRQIQSQVLMQERLLKDQVMMLQQRELQNPMMFQHQQRQVQNQMMKQQQLKNQMMMMIQQHQKELSKKQEEEMTQLMESLKM